MAERKAANVWTLDTVGGNIDDDDDQDDEDSDDAEVPRDESLNQNDVNFK